MTTMSKISRNIEKKGNPEILLIWLIIAAVTFFNTVIGLL